MKNNKIKIITPLLVTAVYIFLYLPIIILVLFSFNDATTTYQWKGFTLHWYSELFRSAEVWFALKNSFIVASSSVVLSLALGTFLVWGFQKRLQTIMPLFYTTVMIPDVVLGVGLLSLFTFLIIPLGLLTLIAAHTLLGLGFVVPIVYTRFSEINYRLIEASLDLGASHWQTFYHVLLPLLKPALIAAGLLVFIVSLDDFVLAFFTSGTESQTLSLYIFSMVRVGLSPIVNAISTLLLVVSCTAVLLASLLSNKPIEEIS